MLSFSSLSINREAPSTSFYSSEVKGHRPQFSGAARVSSPSSLDVLTNAEASLFKSQDDVDSFLQSLAMRLPFQSPHMEYYFDFESHLGFVSKGYSTIYVFPIKSTREALEKGRMPQQVFELGYCNSEGERAVMRDLRDKKPYKIFVNPQEKRHALILSGPHLETFLNLPEAQQTYENAYAVAQGRRPAIAEA